VTREERVQAVVDAGYSRDFAEAYVPMTEREARERQMVTRPYESPMTGLVNRGKRRNRR
jgi:hypothetical protein